MTYSKCTTNSILNPRYLRWMPSLENRLKMFHIDHDSKKNKINKVKKLKILTQNVGSGLM